MEITYCPHEHRGLCTKPDSYWILAYANFWYQMVGKDHFVLYNAAFGRVGFFNFKQTNKLPFLLLCFGGKCGPYCTKENLEGKVNLTGLLGACVALCFLGSLIFLTNWKWGL